MSISTKNIGNRVLALILALCMIFTVCYGAFEHMSDMSVYAVSDISPNAIELTVNNFINKVTASYMDGDNWVEITEENNISLPVNTSYQLEIFFNNLIVKQLVAADYQMIYDQVPDWFIMSEPGNIMFGAEMAARVELMDGKIVINFYEDWVKTHDDDDILNGSFKLFGNIDWRELPENESDRKYPGMNVVFNFEGDLTQKYGSVDIEKSEPALVEDGDGNYYLEYEITVSSLDSVTVPDITVRDLFGNISYINGYVGVDMNGPSEFLPTIDGDAVSNISAVFSKEADGTLVWKIGDLGAEETHTLRYYAQISESYIDSVISNPIQNRAKVFSGAYQKDDDDSSFTPQNTVELQKTAKEPVVDPNGNGMITYTVVVSAPEDNSFDFTGLTFKDSFPADLSYYLSDNSTITVDIDGETREVDYTDGSFELSDIDLNRGDTITITYTVIVNNIFLYNNGEVSLTNVASVSKGSRTLRSGSNTQTLQKINSVRKVYGSETAEDKTVIIGGRDSVYKYTGSSVEDDTNPGSFNVPKGSHKYDVVLNENGNWDMSSTAMKDSFGDNEHIAYTGYVQIRLYKYSNDNTAALSDEALVKELEAYPVEKTIWLKVDGLNDFSFTPQQLGVDADDADEKYTYMLTYYAVTKDMANVGKLGITNDFELSDQIGYGDGKYFPFPGIHVSTSKVITGSANYDAEKIGWYYESLKHLYHTEAITSGAYPPTTAKEDGYTQQYKKGAVYWIIRLEGKIKTGSAETYNSNSPGLSGFYIKDKPANSTINRDAVVGVFKGPKEFDFTQYDSYADFMDEKYPEGTNELSADGMLTRLKGNSQNDAWFHYNDLTKVNNPNYEWFASNTELMGIVFKKEYNLTESDEAIFIVLRTASNTDYSSDNSATGTWTNKLSINDDKTSFDVNTAQLTYQFKGSLFKESKGAFIFDKSTGKFTHCGDQNANNAWNVNTWVGKDNLDSSGVYAAWLLNVNWDGSMEGEAYINDYLPEGMELEYVEVNNFGNSIRSELHNWPTTGYIEELQNDPDWWELSRDQILTANGDRVKDEPITTISYYNPATREIRWHISGLTKTDQYKHYEINFRIICRVVDPELFFSCGSKQYTNYASIWDTETQSDIYMEHADVTIYWNIDKDINANGLPPGSVYNGSLISSSDNKLPFILKLNPLGLDMADGDTLPALIDTMSKNFALIENSIRVFIGDREEYTAFTYDVSEADGCQTIIFNNLPDSTPITITYDVRLTSAPDPDDPPTVTNTAYWQGYDPPKDSQVKDKKFKFIPNGDIFVNKQPSVEIIKADSSSHSKRLQGAVFEIFEADRNGERIGDVIDSGTTDSNGVYSYSSSNNELKYGVMYCIREVSSPSGYKLDDKGRYFVIMNSLDLVIPDHSNEIELDVWYDEPKYSCVVENDKGTIGVEKVFKDSDGKGYTPESGRYEFGLFDGDGNLLETLTIEYTSGGGVNYYLDGLPAKDPYFSNFEPTRRYYIYELDDTGAPIKHGNICELGGTEFKVTYGTDGNSEAFIGSIIKITNRKYANMLLPATGGPGLMKYYFVGALLLVISIVFIAWQYVLLKKKRSA